MASRKILWTEMTTLEIEQAAKEEALVILPTGSIEQHGPHLPLDTDISSPFEIARRAAESLKDFRVIVAPPFPYGISGQHRRFPGTLYLVETTYMTVLQEICRSIVNSGFKRILVFNGHGGNTTANDVALRGSIAWETEAIIVTADWWYFMDREKLDKVRDSYPLWHACELETSIQLALKPHAVNMEEAKNALAKWHPQKAGSKWTPICELVSRGRGGIAPVYPDFKDKSSIGVIGDPLVASAEKGEKFMSLSVEGLVDFLKHFKNVSSWGEL